MQTAPEIRVLSAYHSCAVPVLKGLIHCGALWVTGAGAAAESTSQVEHRPSRHTLTLHTNTIKFTANYYIHPLQCLDNSLWAHIPVVSRLGK